MAGGEPADPPFWLPPMIFGTRPVMPVISGKYGADARLVRLAALEKAGRERCAA